MDTALLSKYARLLLETGLALRPGQNLRITCEPIHWDFVNRLVKCAYEAGARYVAPQLVHPLVSVHRANCSKEAFLSYVPKTASAKVAAQLDEEWSFLRLEGRADPDIFKDMDQDRNAVIARAASESSKPLRNAILAGEKSWCVAPFPTPGWAAQVLGTAPSKATSDAFWQLLVSILRLDNDDPSAVWKAHGDMLQRRCETLDALSLRSLRFLGPDTDLTVYLNPGARWLGGPLTTRDRRIHFPNLPTEEVFTTPDFRRTTGRVKATKPVIVLGVQVDGAWFEFREGAVVDFGAASGKPVLEKYFDIDPKNRYLGEVALVDETSPIARADRIFHTILIDENAACHIALGSGYPAALPDAEGLTDDELDARGCNKALLHVDFMIGSKDTRIVGGASDGEEMSIMEDGVLTLPQ
jgi:aminopeptidase